ncbi:MAG: AbgT family transporter [Prevotella sp.]|nr:AbgT family transporter [Prevotella sp.]
MQKLFSRLAFCLLLVQIVVILFSWIADAMQWLEISSLLSPSGIRWFLSRFTSNIASPMLVWLLLIACAYGALKGSVLHKDVDNNHKRLALTVCSVVTLFIVAGIIALAFIPHAPMLSITGRLFPSPFSDSIVPIICFSVILLSWLYGSVTDTLHTLSDAFSTLVLGVTRFAPLIIVYIFASQLIYSVIYVFF